MEESFNLGEPVRKVGGDYDFEGVVVGKAHKLSGQTRYVVEDDRGILHIYSSKQLEHVPIDQYEAVVQRLTEAARKRVERNNGR